MRTRISLTALTVLLAALQVTAQTVISEGTVEGTWTKNNSPYVVEGAINVANGTKLIIEPGVTVKFNTKERFEIDGCLIAEGTAEDPILFTNYDLFIRWGGIKWINTAPTNDSSKIAYAIFERAYAYGPEVGFNSGAAIAIQYFDKVSIKNSTFRHNLADLSGYYPPSGAAIALWNSSIQISHCVFHNNEARYGGAIIYAFSSNATTDNCLFYANSAEKYGGAVEVYDGRLNPYLINCTFSDNHAGIAGGAIDVFEAYPNVTNCILWGNTADVEQTQVHMRYSSSGLNVYYTNIENGEEGFSGFPNLGEVVSMLDTVPEFTREEDPPLKYSISDSSPCVDNGSLDTLYLPDNWVCPCFDLVGQDRILEGGIDLGSFERDLVWTVLHNGYANVDLNFELYPNPVNKLLNMNFALNAEQTVNLSLYTQDGRYVKGVVNKTLSPGLHRYQLNMGDLQKGYYLLKLKAGNNLETKKVIKL